MEDFNPQPGIHPRVLATDLDGTFIPLPDSDENRVDLECIRALRDTHRFGLIYATGRHYESVLEAARHYNLPAPDWIICDVGTDIYQRIGTTYELFAPYAEHLTARTSGMNREAIESLLDGTEGLTLQSTENQQRFKISYLSRSEDVHALVQKVNTALQQEKLPYACLGSMDPFRHCGLIDVLPVGVSKAYALIWLSTHADFEPDEVIYAGDSGNDLAALISGFRAIVVANGSSGLAEEVARSLKTRDLDHHLFIATRQATSGVLEGCRHFGLI